MVSRRRFGYLLRDQLAAIKPELAINLSFSESIIELWPVREAFMFFSLLADPHPCSWRAWLGYRNSPPATDSRVSSFNSDAYRRFLLASQGTVTSRAVIELANEGETVRRGSGGKNLWGRARRYAQLVSEKDWGTLSAEGIVEAAFEPDLRLTGESHDVDMVSHDLRLLTNRAMATLALAHEPEDPQNKHKVLKEVADDLRYAIAVREPLAVSDEGAVTVTTFWGAKGLTAEHVYMLGACDEAIPGEVTDDYPGSPGEHFEEQRRLFYVSLTRTRRTLVVSWPQMVRWGDLNQLRLKRPRSQFNTRFWAQLSPSSFLRNIESALDTDVARGEQWHLVETSV